MGGNHSRSGAVVFMHGHSGPVAFVDKWSPALQIRTVLLSIQALLSAPNPDDPLANDIAEQWKTNEAQAIETARAWTRLYAMNNI